MAVQHGPALIHLWTVSIMKKISNTWLAQNIQQGRGPLGAAYPDVAWGVEGDTPAFLSLIPNGLNNSEQAGVAVTNYTSRILHRLKKEVRSLKGHPRQGKSGQTQMIVIRHIFTKNMDGQLAKTPRPSPVIKWLCGVGGMIFKVILPPAWIGVLNHIRRQINYRDIRG